MEELREKEQTKVFWEYIVCTRTLEVSYSHGNCFLVLSKMFLSLVVSLAFNERRIR
jgi:hypothetical protein